MDDSMNKIMAQLQFGITGALTDLETLEREAQESAARIKKTMAKATLTTATGGLNTGQMTASQAMVTQIFTNGEAQRTNAAAESAVKQQKIAQETALKLEKGYGEINAAAWKSALEREAAEKRIEATESNTASKAKESALKQQQLSQETVLAMEKGYNQIDIASSKAAQDMVIAREKADAAILNSAETTAAKIAKVNAETGLVGARTSAVTGVADSQMALNQAREQAILQESKAKEVATTIKGESDKTKALAQGALSRQKTVTEEMRAELLTVQQAMAKEKLAYMQARQAAFESAPSGMSGLLTRHLSWFATGAVLFEGFDLLKTALVDVETGMKGLTTVLPELHQSQTAYNKAKEDAIGLMKKYGESVDEVMTSARSFGRMYKDEATVMGLVNNSILMNVVDRVELTDAVRGNEAALAVYGDALKSTNEIMAFSNHTMDAWTRLSHESMASATDLINITERASGAAKVAKTNFDQLMGLGASSVRATGLPGANIGNMLKTVMAQLAAPTDKVEEKIENIGVKMRDVNGQLRSGYDILLDLSLATKDATVTQEELANAEQAAASGRRKLAA